MNNKNIDTVYKILTKHVEDYNVPVVDLIEIQTEDPFKVLIATILSARTKDEVTAQVCKRLFAVVKNLNDFNKLSNKELEDLIYPVGFYKTKAKHLKELPKVIKDEFNEIIPKTISSFLVWEGRQQILSFLLRLKNRDYALTLMCIK